MNDPTPEEPVASYVPLLSRVWDRALVLLRAGYCKGSIAMDDRHRPISCLDDNASSFCLVGAIYRAAVESQVDVERYLNRLRPMVEPLGSLEAYSDQEKTTLADIEKLIAKVRATQ
jgi:hypothetical protein